MIATIRATAFPLTQTRATKPTKPTTTTQRSWPSYRASHPKRATATTNLPPQTATRCTTIEETLSFTAPQHQQPQTMYMPLPVHHTHTHSKKAHHHIIHRHLPTTTTQYSTLQAAELEWASTSKESKTTPAAIAQTQTCPIWETTATKSRGLAAFTGTTKRLIRPREKRRESPQLRKERRSRLCRQCARMRINFPAIRS